MADDFTDLALRQVFDLRRRWLKDDRPGPALGHALVAHGGFLLAESAGEATVSTTLRLLADELDRQVEGSPTIEDTRPAPTERAADFLRTMFKRKT